jgi:hypothetical protein
MTAARFLASVSL